MSINPNQEPKLLTLADVLQLQAAIESLSGAKWRDISETERIAINTFPEGEESSEGKIISHIGLTQKNKETGCYDTYMNYMVLRDGDEASTRLIKRPPFVIGEGVDFTDQEAVNQEFGRATVAASEYKAAEEIGMFDVTANEVQELSATIEREFATNS